mmetsp:Transcript_1596/g.3514  ORF Transcript_1596/g.3514 Transcript_1596/m.3514 type:complete len:100 (+) Transcript_1596:135-434(+)
MDELQQEIGKLYSSIEGAEDAKFLTFDVTKSRTYDKEAPKLITMDGARKLLLENPDCPKALMYTTAKGGESDVTTQVEAKPKDSKESPSVLAENLDQID